MSSIYATSLKELGEALRHSREASGASVKDVADNLRIRHMYITAIEQGDWSVLPGQAYGRGYLRQYATYLGLPGEEVILLCDQLQGKVNTELRYFTTEMTEQKPSNGLVWACIITVVALAISWMVYQNDQTPEIDEPYAMPEAIQSYIDPQKIEGVPQYSPAVQQCLSTVRLAPIPCYYFLEVPKDAPKLAYWPIAL